MATGQSSGAEVVERVTTILGCTWFGAAGEAGDGDSDGAGSRTPSSWCGSNAAATRTRRVVATSTTRRSQPLLLRDRKREGAGRAWRGLVGGRRGQVGLLSAVGRSGVPI
jgi:hypothetical protein